MRVCGTLLDGLLLIPGYVMILIGTGIAGDPTATSGTEAVGWTIAGVAAVAQLCFSIWNLIIREGRTGSSLGKSWVNIKVVSEATGQPTGGWSILGRRFVHILDALPCYIGFLWPLWDDKRQTFADKLMNTVVVPIPPTAPEPYTPTT
jgi:uncharacterized RDD family membrane protein YckC